MQPDDMPQLLRDWAEWEPLAKAAGYSDSTTIFRAYRGDVGGGTFSSREPTGIWKLWAHPRLRRLIKVLANLEPDPPECVSITKAFYRGGPGPLVSLGMDYSTLVAKVREGEILLKNQMDNHT